MLDGGAAFMATAKDLRGHGTRLKVAEVGHTDRSSATSELAEESCIDASSGTAESAKDDAPVQIAGPRNQLELSRRRRKDSDPLPLPEKWSNRWPIG